MTITKEPVYNLDKHGPITANLEQNRYHAMNRLKNGLPFDGTIQAVGLDIKWQGGPLAENSLNGCFVEDVLIAAQSRLEFYQGSKFKSEHNQRAIDAIQVAIDALVERTAKRKEDGVEGTHAIGLMEFADAVGYDKFSGQVPGIEEFVHASLKEFVEEIGPIVAALPVDKLTFVEYSLMRTVACEKSHLELPDGPILKSKIRFTKIGENQYGLNKIEFYIV